MKLSLAWIFDHIDYDWKKVDVPDLVSKINKVTAEIENFYKININTNNLILAKIVSINSETVILRSTEIKKDIELPIHKNINKDTDINKNFLIYYKDNIFRWGLLTDLGSEKEGYLPSLFDETSWKKKFESEDYIFELDNKSITHRPDLWGHRGFAREVAAILDLLLLPIEDMLFKSNIEKRGMDFCKSFSYINITNIKIDDSHLWMANRLAKIDSRPINYIVDTTNYVMFDIGQPMHAFDAKKLTGKVFPRLAKSGEQIVTLDNSLVNLSTEDIVVADENGPIAIAGIMGGKNTEVDFNTMELIVESACFDAASIRKSSIRIKKRTEASTRFEKNLDPNQTVIAIERFLSLIQKCEMPEVIVSKIINYNNNNIKNNIIEIEHDFIQKRLGITIDSNFIINLLKKLNFDVTVNNFLYNITVPTNRSTKDILIPEDIVEEIARFFGYDKIKFDLPIRKISPFDITSVTNIRKIKQFMAYTCKMHEVQNYPFFDEDFLKELNWIPDNSLSVMSPVSENWKTLVTSLIPHLLKNIQQNLNKYDQLRFFELNRIWNNSLEKKSLSGIFFDAKKDLDFYDFKSYLSNFFNMFHINMNWVNSFEHIIWYDEQNAAILMYENEKIGVAGKISKNILSKFSKGDAFIFELDVDWLLNHKLKINKFKTLPKYPVVWLDFSMFIPLNITIDYISNIMKNSDSKIYKIELIDLFLNKEWKDKKSVTLRIYLIDELKTLSKPEIDLIINKVTNNLCKEGAQLR